MESPSSLQRLSAVEVLLRLVGSLVLTTGWCLLAAAWEATTGNLDRLWMLALTLLVAPILYLLGEAIHEPLIEAIGRLPWWISAGSAVRVVLGVLMTLPFFTFGVWMFWKARQWLEVPGW